MRQFPKQIPKPTIHGTFWHTLPLEGYKGEIAKGPYYEYNFDKPDQEERLFIDIPVVFVNVVEHHEIGIPDFFYFLN